MPEVQHAISAATLEALTDTHRDIFTRAVRNVLSTNTAEETYAQVLDGLPLSKVERDRWSHYTICASHPLHNNHKTLCPGVLERLRQLHDQIDVGQVLKFDSKVFAEMLLLSQIIILTSSSSLSMISAPQHLAPGPLKSAWSKWSPSQYTK